MNLHGQIELINVPQEFARLCNAILSAEYGDDFLPIDDDRPDRGNDGYLKSEHRMFAMHCFKRLQNQQLEREVASKMTGDLKKAIQLKHDGRWIIDAWTFISNYPISESVAAPVVRTGTQAGINVSWRGPLYLADILQRHPEVRTHFPNLQVNEVGEQLRSLTSQIARASGDLSADLIQVGVPDNRDEQARLLVQRPPGWEYLLFAGVLRRETEKIGPKLQDHELHYAPRIDRYLDLREGPGYISRAMKRAMKVTPALMRLFDTEVQVKAFGSPGEPGDPERIAHLAVRVVGSVEEFLDWAADLRGIQVSRELERSFELAAQVVDQPILDILQFITSYVTQAEQIFELLAQPRSGPISRSLTLTLTMDDDAVARCIAELERVVR